MQWEWLMERLQGELDALAVRLGRSLTIDSATGELFAYSAQRDDADEARISTILLRHVSAEVVAWEAAHLGADPVDPVVIPANPALDMSARLCVPLRTDSRLLGYLYMVDSGTALDEDERAALTEGAQVLTAQLKVVQDQGASAHASGHETDRLLRRLFEEGDGEAYARIATVVPDILDGSVQVITAVVAGADGARQLKPPEFSALNSSLSTILRTHPIFIGSCATTMYALVVAHHRSAAELTALLGELDWAVQRCLTPGGTHRIGISEASRLELRTAREIRGQAVTAAEMAVLDPALDQHQHYAALGPYRLLGDGQSTQESQVLSPLKESGTSGPMLLETLETYLDLAGDVQNVAARLNLHRSSLYYRLDRIGRLLGVDLSDGMTRLALHIELKKRRLHQRILT